MSAAISANLVKELREKTGVGMMECKKALTKTEGDMDAAVKLLRESGAAKAAKRAERSASEGVIEFVVADDGKSGAIVELNCETDFAARNEEFIAAAKQLQASNAANLLEVTLDNGKQASALVDELLAKIGEKITLSNAEFVSGDAVAGYIHPPGKIGVLVAATGEISDPAASQPVLRDVAMHIAAANPRFTTEDEVDEETLKAEDEIAASIARKEGKPENIIPKIVEGKRKSFYKENCLLNQIFVKDGKATVQQVLDQNGKLKIAKFVRYQTGE